MLGGAHPPRAQQRGASAEHLRTLGPVGRRSRANRDHNHGVDRADDRGGILLQDTLLETPQHRTRRRNAYVHRRSKPRLPVRVLQRQSANNTEEGPTRVAIAYRAEPPGTCGEPSRTPTHLIWHDWALRPWPRWIRQLHCSRPTMARKPECLPPDASLRSVCVPLVHPRHPNDPRSLPYELFTTHIAQRVCVDALYFQSEFLALETPISESSTQDR